MLLCQMVIVNQRFTKCLGSNFLSFFTSNLTNLLLFLQPKDQIEEQQFTMSLASDRWTSLILRTIVLTSCHLSSRRLKSTIRNESWDQLLDIDDATIKCVLFQVVTNEDKRPKIHNEPWEQPLDNNWSTNN